MRLEISHLAQHISTTSVFLYFVPKKNRIYSKIYFSQIFVATDIDIKGVKLEKKIYKVFFYFHIIWCLCHLLISSEFSHKSSQIFISNTLCTEDDTSIKIK